MIMRMTCPWQVGPVEMSDPPHMLRRTQHFSRTSLQGAGQCLPRSMALVFEFLNV
jgi:hypothetical protein